ncbi:hypothetical protein SAY86_000133 [Trapa natans]|uniref:Uncharacterized protein n=1 Tax=Trapa natans TaxID=22666 RepID=A0AAN7M9P5_TRANT|nr:hypothetical protein SAY86_000133 [Trapa natans]
MSISNERCKQATTRRANQIQNCNFSYNLSQVMKMHMKKKLGFGGNGERGVPIERIPSSDINRSNRSVSRYLPIPILRPSAASGPYTVTTPKELTINTIKVLCNADVSEGIFKAGKDVSLPETTIRTAVNL